MNKLQFLKTYTHSAKNKFTTLLAIGLVLPALASASAFADTATKAVQLQQQPPLLLGNDAVHCSQYRAMYGYGNGSGADNWSFKIVLNGQEQNPNQSWFIGYKDTSSVTETANRAQDYFIKNGKQVKSVTYNLTLPRTAYCEDKPITCQPITVSMRPGQIINEDLVKGAAHCTDPDGPQSGIKITDVYDGFQPSGSQITTSVIKTRADGSQYVQIAAKTNVSGSAVNLYTLKDSMGKPTTATVTIKLVN